MDYYSVLGVDRVASREEIRAAYRRLVRELHPDVNRSPAAHARMAEINVAYSVLSDSEKRSAYDEWTLGSVAEGTATGTGGPSSGTRHRTESPTDARGGTEAPLLKCDRCGTVDETLTATIFHYVLPLLIVVQHGYRTGVFCERCRAWLSLLYTLEVLLLSGFGGIFGIIWGVSSFWHNVRGGEEPPAANAALSWNLAILHARWLAFEKALRAAERSYRYQPSPETADLVAELQRRVSRHGTRHKRSIWSSPLRFNGGAMAALVLGVTLVGVAVPPSSPAVHGHQASPDVQGSDYRDGIARPHPVADEFDIGREVRQQLHNEAEDLAREIEDLESDLDDLSSEIEDLRYQIEDAERRLRLDLGASDDRYTSLIDEHDRKVHEYNEMLEEGQAKVDRYNAIVDQLQ